MSRSIYLSAGHSNKFGRDNGAVGNGFIEGVEAVKVRKRVSEILIQVYGCKVFVDKDDSILSETINFLKNLTTNNCIVVDIHFNAATPQASGTETLIPSNPTQFEIDLAYSLSHVAHLNLGVQKRGGFTGRKGVKTELESHHGRLGWMRLTGQNVLIELCFISNKRDMDAYVQKFEEYCQDVALVLYKFSIDKQVEVLSKIK